MKTPFEKMILLAVPPDYAWSDDGVVRIGAAGDLAAYAVGDFSRHCLIFCHGNGETAVSERYWFERLAEAGVSVICPDYRGYGLSAGELSERGCYEAAHAAYEWLVAEKNVPPSRITVLGYSLGSAVAVELATTVRLASLILQAPFVSGAALRPVWECRFGGQPSGGPETSFPTSERLSSVRVPALVIHGTADDIIPFAQGKTVCERIASRKKRFVPVKGAGHCNFQFFLGDTYLRTLVEFVEQPGWRVLGMLKWLGYDKPFELTILTVLHPLVDFCSVAVLALGGITFERWLAYNALAFALQLPLGVALDARPTWSRTGFALGCALAAGGAVVAAFGWTGWLPLVAACVGNALFHLTAGATVLSASPGKSGPVGLFISTGALGLMAGHLVAKGGGRGATALPLWAVAVVAAVAVALTVGAAWRAVRWNGCVDATLPSRQVEECGASGARTLPWLVAGLFALVVWRSWAGLLAGGMSSGAGLAFVLAGAAVTWAGKAAGGYVADAFTMRGLVTAASVAGSVALCFLCSPAHMALWLVLLFVAQLATGPVLSLMHDALGRRAGTAFGLNCLGLFTGSLV